MPYVISPPESDFAPSSGEKDEKNGVRRRIHERIY
jgi:hypothetical protein